MCNPQLTSGQTTPSQPEADDTRSKTQDTCSHLGRRHLTPICAKCYINRVEIWSTESETDKEGNSNRDPSETLVEVDVPVAKEGEDKGEESDDEDSDGFRDLVRGRYGTECLPADNT